MKRFKLKKPNNTKTVSQLIHSLETDNKDVDAILEAARLQRIEQKERSHNRLKIMGMICFTIVMVAIIICTYLADALLLGMPIIICLSFFAVMACCNF